MDSIAASKVKKICVTTESPEEIVQHRVAHQYHLSQVQRTRGKLSQTKWDVFWNQLKYLKWESVFSSRISTEKIHENP